MQYDNYSGNDKLIKNFIKLPESLFSDERLKKLSSDAKLLYALLLGRASISAKQNWVDKDKRVYVICTIEEVMDRMQCSKGRAVKILDELDTQRGVGLIERKRQGLGRPNLIYVKNCYPFNETANIATQAPNNGAYTSQKPAAPLQGKLDSYSDLTW